MSVVFVHIGLPKTGTTHLQDRLWRNRDVALRTSGLLYPGNVISDHFHVATHLQPERYLDWADPAFAGTWPTMRAQMRAWPGNSLLSHELFATATDAHIATLLDDLSFADEVHVIATVRDLARQLPSVWQENVKNQRPTTFDAFIDNVRAHADPPDAPMDADGPEEPFWEFQDYVAILERWAAAVGPERIHVVTVPATRAAAGDGLWERFLAVLDIDPALLNLPVPSTNKSLSAAQAEFLRQLNSRVQPEHIEWRRYERVIKGQVIGEILFASRSGPPQGLSAAQRSWASRQAAHMIDGVKAAGYAVSGDLADLEVKATAAGDVTAPTTQQVLDVALDTLAEMVQRAPLPDVAPRWRTRGRNLLRRAARRATALRTPRR